MKDRRFDDFDVPHPDRAEYALGGTLCMCYESDEGRTLVLRGLHDEGQMTSLGLYRR